MRDKSGPFNGTDELFGTEGRNPRQADRGARTITG